MMMPDCYQSPLSSMSDDELATLLQELLEALPCGSDGELVGDPQMVARYYAMLDETRRRWALANPMQANPSSISSKEILAAMFASLSRMRDAAKVRHAAFDREFTRPQC